MYPPGPYEPSYLGAEAGPSRPRPASTYEPTAPLPKPKKRRRLQFTSQMRNSIQRYNPDGTETVEYLHQQSTQRLKRKWDSIFERFKDAHLQEQDEIYLGNRANGEPIVVVKDRGSLRSLRQSMEFGVFIKDEELQGWKDRPEAREMDDREDEYDDDIHPTHGPFQAHRGTQQLAGVSSSESEDQEDDPAANDPDLREFLQAEARRKALLGDTGQIDQEAEGEDVIDFGDPMWSSSVGDNDALMARRRPPLPPPSRKLVPPRGTDRRSPSRQVSSSEDQDDTDVVTVHSDSDEELVDSIRTKRQNIEELLQCTTPFETLPYNDIFGLADLLKITDNTSRLYIDLVSDEEDEEQVIEVTNDDLPATVPEDTVDAEAIAENNIAEPTSPHPSSLIVDPTCSQESNPAASPTSSAMPQPSIVPASSARSRPCTAVRPASQTVIKLEMGSSQERVSLRTPSTVRQTEDLAEAEPKESRSSSPAEPAETLCLLPTPSRVREAATRTKTYPPVPSLDRGIRSPSTLLETLQPADRIVQEEVISLARAGEAAQFVTLQRCSPVVDGIAYSLSTPSPEPLLATRRQEQTKLDQLAVDASAAQEQSSTLTRSTSSANTHPHPTPESTGEHSPQMKQPASSTSLHGALSNRGKQKHRSSTLQDPLPDPMLDASLDCLAEPRVRGKRRKRPKCGGPKKCQKTFCLHCATLTLSSRV
ncbi:uncharacterized protein UBRO_06652 [Ustilago bromivora]|uniref:Uncharacterized protein n=1 Tax=Ustilago bromivora TaxID=307758 RepID=A0A1K0G7I5_9BASI|nr:uncharacterized protein UBRO_06652 [Ustilago bromivora]SYW73829.1 uncharacterized protein UBRO2_00104 [Ustilago bromivora]